MMMTPTAPAWLEIWKNPPAEYRGKPFWSWNGNLDPVELRRQARIFKEMGMGGYFMHSRTGLVTRYLGREWFECIEAGADEAERLGMEAWLYDEDRWPSGSAGGLATRDERYRAKYLRLTVVDGSPGAGKNEMALSGWPDREHFVAAFCAPMDRQWLEGSYLSVSYGDRPKPGQSLLIFSWEEAREHSFYNGQTYLDTMSAEATENYLRITHDAYAAACGNRLGHSIKGIFTDEPSRGFVFCDNHGQPGAAGETGMVTPWTPSLWEAFEKTFGYDLRTRLPELFLLLPGDQRISPVKWQYMELCQRLFMENWARPMQERCRSLGLTLTGHALHEDSLAAQAVPCGSILRYYEYFDYPGVDVLGLSNTNFHVVKQLSSVGRQFGKPWLMSELYGCSGWQTDFEDHKRIGDWQALFGINLRCHHLSWYSMAGEAKRDYPASISFQSAWWPEYEAIETYFSRLHVLLQAGEPLCDVLVIHPVESLWAQIHVGWATWLRATDPHVLALEKKFTDVFAWLCGAQIDFDYGDEEHIARRAVIEPSGELILGPMRYRVVVVAGMETMRASTLNVLRRFREEGGTVIFAGLPPRHVDALPSATPNELSERCKNMPLERAALVHAIREESPANDVVRVDSPGNQIFCQVRRDGESTIIVLLNVSETEDYSQTGVSLKGLGPVTELDCLTGEAHVVEAQATEDRLRWQTDLRPLQERVFVCGTVVPGTLPPESPASSGGEWTAVSEDTKYEYALDEPNIAVLDMAEFSIGEQGPWETRREILRVEEALCERLGIPLRGGEMVQPWAVEKKESENSPAILRLRFTFNIIHLPAGPTQIMMEQPGRYGITLNGKTVSVPEDTDWLIDPCFRIIPLSPGVLQEGLNELVLQASFGEDLDLEAIYLLGDFGVETKGGEIILDRLPHRLGTGDWTHQGLPFYSGRISLTIPVDKARRLKVHPMGAATLVFRHSSGTLRKVIPWKPFESALDGLVDDRGRVIVEWVLTRRNTFGPLHLVPVKQDSIGPRSFRSQGEGWADYHQLIPVGLQDVFVQ